MGCALLRKYTFSKEVHTCDMGLAHSLNRVNVSSAYESLHAVLGVGLLKRESGFCRFLDVAFLAIETIRQ